MFTPTAAPYPPDATAKWWDEAARPVREAPSTDETYSEIGIAVRQHLVEVHDHLRGELDQLIELVAQLRDGAVDGGQARSFIAAMTIRQNSWTVGAYCASYCRILTQHHSLEDAAVFPHLRASDETLAPVLDRLAEEHLIVHGVLEDLDASFVAYLADPTDFSVVERSIDALAKTLLSHLAYEEAQLLEPLARHGFHAGQVPTPR